MNLFKNTTNPKFIMLVGAPGSGKSTWINDFVSSNNEAWVVLSTDKYIEAWAAARGLSYAEAFVHPKFSFKKDALSKVNIGLRQALNKNQNIIMDQTNMTVNSRKKKLSQIPDNYEKAAVVFDIDRDELTRRNDKRKGETGKTVPLKVINDMIESYETPSKSESFDTIHLINA